MRSCNLQSLNSTERKNTMKRYIYFIIIAISLTLVFSQGKPCCKNKTCKGKISCKFNQAAIGTDKDAAGELTAETTDGNQKSLESKVGSSKCDKRCTNKPWWKFWVKKKNCCNTKV